MKKLSTNLEMVKLFIHRKWTAFWKLLIKLLSIFFTGIRAKLALFTGSLIFFTVLTLTIITVNQQNQLLTESYSKEVAMSRNFISNFVLSLDSISKNIIRIEEFREQIVKKSAELKKYRTTQIVEVEKKVNLFGIKTNLFGTLGKEKFKTHQDSFYSRYLSKEDIRKLEFKIKFEIEQLAGRRVGQKEWEELLSLAKQFISKSGGEKNDLAKSNVIRSQLENKLFSLMLNKNISIIETIGLDTDRFRIQTFPITGLSEDRIFQPTFDSSVFNKESPLSSLNITESMNESLLIALNDLSENPTLQLSENTYTFQENDLVIEIFYSPLFKNPHSTQRSLALIQSIHLMERIDELLEEDRKISKNLSDIFPKIQSRLKYLRDKSPPQPPFKDKEYNSLYDRYFALLDSREKLFQTYILNEKNQSINPVSYDSLLYLRESYWEDSILNRYSHTGFNISQFEDEQFNKDYLKKWSALRTWIRIGKEETVPKYLSDIFPDGTIGKSRSEAEEIMWEVDSTPILTEEGNYSAKNILTNNLTGTIRTFVDKTDGVKILETNRNTAIISAVIVSFLAIVFAIFISGITVEKIKRIISNAELVGQGRLDVEFEHGGNDEFGKLTVAMNHMVNGLREREKIKSILGAMIDPVVVGEAIKDIDALRKGSEREITAFFSDIAGFTTISEKLSSVELGELLNTYLSEMTIILKNYGGVLDKYIGDAIVGIFNSPLDVSNHTEKAVQASLKMLNRLEELKKYWVSTNKYIMEVQQMSIRIGINTGVAKVGLMGTHSISSYTMMGDTVNLAARLESAGKDYGVNILISEQVKNQVKDKFLLRRLDIVQVKGKSQPVTLYEPISEINEASDQSKEAVGIFEQGFQAYLSKDWDRAIQFLEKSISKSKGIFTDKTAKMILTRCINYSKTPPPDNWDGVYIRENK